MTRLLLRRRLIPALLLVLLAVPAAGQSAKWPSSGPPRPLAARDVTFPPYEVRKLPNGMQVVVVVHDEQPVVSIRAIVQAGGAQDPVERPGVAAMVSTLLDQGTTTLTAQQVAETIDSAGGTLRTGLGRDLSFVAAVLLKDDLAMGMSLLADVLRNPSFAQEELERQRQQTLSALKVAYEDPGYIADLVFDRLVYGSHPYGLPGNGTVESLQAMTRGDLAAFHKTYYVPNNTLLAIVGDVTVDEAMAAAAKAFGDWPAREVPASSSAKPPDPERRLIVLDRPGAAQTEIRAGLVGVPRNTDDYQAVDLLIKILGGEGANRLHRVLRVERGLTYSASAEIESLKRSGQFVAQTSTRGQTTGEALRLIVDEFSRLRREGVGERELEDAKAYLTGHFPLTIETPDEIGIQVLNALFYELPLDGLQTYRQRVNAVTPDDIRRAALRFLRADRLSIVLVGDAESFLDELARVGFAKHEVVRLDEFDVMSPDFRRKKQ